MSKILKHYLRFLFDLILVRCEVSARSFLLKDTLVEIILLRLVMTDRSSTKDLRTMRRTAASKPFSSSIQAKLTQSIG